MKKLASILLSVFVLISFINCNKGSDSEENLPIDLSGEIFDEQLSRTTYTNGNVNSDLVIVDLQGGPVLDFDKNSLSFLLEGGEFPHPLMEDALVVNVHQYQTLYPEFFKKRIITFEEAKEYDEQTTKWFMML